MKPILRLLRWSLVSALLATSVLLAAPASAAEAMQIWRCELGDDATEESVEKHAQDWLKAARQVKGGAGLKAHVLFPVAAHVVGQTDFMVVVIAPTFEDWGKFWDNYKDSPAAQTEAESKIACPHSSVWESINVVVD